MDYRISTITTIASLNSLINLQKMYDSFEFNIDTNNIFYNDTNNEVNIVDEIKFIEYGKTKDISNSKGINLKKVKKNTYKKKEKIKKRFDNQLTIVLQINNNNINMKLFKNGRVQMTGLKDINNGPIAIKFIINLIKKMNCDFLDIDQKSLDYNSYKICLINSDFKFTSKLRRNKLFAFINNNTELVCSYEPCIYPGVKIQFFYNNSMDGICRCENGYCSNKNKNSQCIKVTVAIFESGCTIITGAKSLDQINTTYKYIKDLLVNNIEVFKKIDLDELLLE
jgi:TATA-box binding protein (TBP) (component of TFIID and TFIIIB)